MVARISATGYKTQDVNVMIVPQQAAAKPGAQNNNPMGNLPSFERTWVRSSWPATSKSWVQ